MAESGYLMWACWNKTKQLGRLVGPLRFACFFSMAITPAFRASLRAHAEDFIRF